MDPAAPITRASLSAPGDSGPELNAQLLAEREDQRCGATMAVPSERTSARCATGDMNDAGMRSCIPATSAAAGSNRSRLPVSTRSPWGQVGLDQQHQQEDGR